MKIGRKALVLLAIVIPVVILGMLGMKHSQQVNEQTQLKADLVVAKQRLATLQTERIASPVSGLEKELNDALAELNTAKGILSQPISSITATDQFYAIAHSCGVEITQINETGLTDSVLNKIKGLDISLTVIAEGELLNMIDFVKRLNNEYATGTVEAAKITLDTEEGVKPSVKVDFVIYSYNGE